MTLTYRLQPGRALVLSGPHGSGKTLLARGIAAQHGTYRMADERALLSAFRLGRALDRAPRVLVVDDVSLPSFGLSSLKMLVTEEQTTVERKGRQPKAVRRPLLVFCTTAPPEQLADLDPRRFEVVAVPPAP